MDRTKASDAFNAGSIPVSRSFLKPLYFQRKCQQTLKTQGFSFQIRNFLCHSRNKKYQLFKKVDTKFLKGSLHNVVKLANNALGLFLALVLQRVGVNISQRVVGLNRRMPAGTYGGVRGERKYPLLDRKREGLPWESSVELV